ncbi:hypothetical protein DPMN_024166 [Dreissena polymorpha]|uniref:Uncharacterized protein n=1 Tax=Dreissena polymorpha TaxID=45954 RepID=A0A9D4RAK2_DREPO|nr:hypothetical protein DPMN_024166 [Dreissena polymorpha]
MEQGPTCTDRRSARPAVGRSARAAYATGSVLEPGITCVHNSVPEIKPGLV